VDRLFLTDAESKAVAASLQTDPVRGTYWRLRNLADRWAASPGPVDHHARFEWYFIVPAAIQMTAMACAIKPVDAHAAWLRRSVLSLVRMPEDAWVGPWFMDHKARPCVGHLETGHIAAAVSVAYDLGSDAFAPAEKDEIAACLRERAIPMCLRWLDRTPRAMNWCTILLHGAAVAAAVLDDGQTIGRCAQWFDTLSGLWQPDGSYAESQQYASYAALGMMWTWEALARRRPDLAARLDIGPYARSVRWWTHGLLYHGPLDGAGAHLRPRVANFHDCSAVFRPAADLLLHIARRAPDHMAVERGLAMWLFQTLHRFDAYEDFQDLQIHGLRNDFGFLTLPLLPGAPEAITPQAAGLAPLAAFSVGECFARRSFGPENPTTLAVQGGADPLRVCNHRHASANSFVLTHRGERLLADPGHSCYRSGLRTLDLATNWHNTCTFEGNGQVYLGGERPLRADRSTLSPPADPVGRQLIAEQADDVVAIGYDCAAAYGEPLMRFARFWLLCGDHVLFLVDRIESVRPVQTTWHWVLDNRDGRLLHKTGPTRNLLIRRGDAGMKLFHLGSGDFQGPRYGFLHDWYSPEPDQAGEGRNGTALAYSVTDPERRSAATTAHAIGMGGFGGTASWHLAPRDHAGARLEGQPESERFAWTLTVEDERGPAVSVEHSPSGRRYDLAPGSPGLWRLSRTGR
jgi:hypothetical protein